MKSTRPFLLLVMLVPAASVFAQTITFVVVEKKHIYTQTDTGTVTERASNPWGFQSAVEGDNLVTSTNPISSASTNVAAGSTSPNLTLVFNTQDKNWGFSQLFSAQTSLDATFADGNYTVNVGATPVTLALSGGLYPNNPVPTFSAGSWVGNKLEIDPTQALTINSSTFSTNFSSGLSRVGIDIYGGSYSQDVDTKAGGYTANSTFLTLAANALTGGQTYNVQVEFNRFTEIDSAISGADSVAVYSSVVEFQIYAIPEPSTYAAIFGGLACLGVAFKRRRALAGVMMGRRRRAG